MRFLKITSLVLALLLLAFLSLSLAQSGAPAARPQTGHVSFTADMLDKISILARIFTATLAANGKP